MSICLVALSSFSAHHPAPSTSLSWYRICVSHLERFLIVSYLNFSRDFCSRLLTLFARRSSFRPPPLMNLVLDSRATAWAPWHYVHPQTDHATFQPTPYVHPTFCPLWQFSTATLRPCDIFSTVTFRLCDNFLLWHFDHVTFFYCDIPTLWQFSTVTRRPCDIFLLWHSDSVTIFYCDIPSQSGRIVCPPQNVDVLSHCEFWHCNFGQPMAVTFCPLRILIFPVNTLSKLHLILTDDNLLTLSL